MGGKMDKREAMLRELNLYPMWVRREPVVQVEAIEQCAVEMTIGVEIPFFEMAADPAPVSGNDSLRELQLRIAAGPLADVAWPELKEKVLGCELCNLRAGCTQTVFGSGDEQADWMFIGEAPGAEEDETGEPFVGHAGRLLDNMLLAIKLKRSEVYIANVIKCRPEGDRHPHVGEISTCLPFLRRQIDLVRPKIIVALGRTAAAALLDTDATIASLRGKVHEYKGIALIVTYHPAYLLRSPMEKAKTWQDLCLAVDVLSDAGRIIDKLSALMPPGCIE